MSDYSPASLGSTQDPAYVPSQESSDDDSEDDCLDEDVLLLSQISPAPDFDLGSSPPVFGSVNMLEEEDADLREEEEAGLRDEEDGLGEEDDGLREEDDGLREEMIEEKFCDGDVPSAPAAVEKESKEEENVEDKKRIKSKNLLLDPEEHVRLQIPKTTKKATDYAVNLFNTTMKEVSKKLSFQHQELKDVSVEYLPLRLSKFIMVVTKTNGSSFNASSLETIYASLARYLANDYIPKQDIKKEVRYNIVKQNLDSSKRESTTEGERPGKNKSRAFKDEHIALAWEKRALGRNSPHALISTVQLILISNLGFRANLEIYDILNEDIKMGTMGEGGVPEWIEVSERITKTRTGKSHNIRGLEQKVYADHENPETCPVRTLVEFQRRKTMSQRLPDQPYLLGVKGSAKSNPSKEEFWFNNQRMGTHTIAKLLPRAFTSAGIDVKLEHYSNTSGRKSMLEGGVDAGVPSVLLSKVAGQAAFNSI